MKRPALYHWSMISHYCQILSVPLCFYALKVGIFKMQIMQLSISHVASFLGNVMSTVLL